MPRPTAADRALAAKVLPEIRGALDKLAMVYGYLWAEDESHGALTPVYDAVKATREARDFINRDYEG